MIFVGLRFELVGNLIDGLEGVFVTRGFGFDFADRFHEITGIIQWFLRYDRTFFTEYRHSTPQGLVGANVQLGELFVNVFDPVRDLRTTIRE